MPESCSRGSVVCPSPAAAGGPSPTEEGRGGQPESSAFTGLCSLGVAHNDVPAKKRAPQVSGLVYGHRQAAQTGLDHRDTKRSWKGLGLSRKICSSRQ